ncbi:MAG: 50S ribosomal protein L11 methyltransferase [Actinomycetota bacterium]
MHTLVEISLDDLTSPETVSDRLWVLGAVGVEERSGTVVGAFVDPDRAAVAATELGGRARSVADTAGLDAWREHARVVVAGPFAVRPPWLDPGPGIDLVIDPGHTFGSGSHPTTRLATALLANRVEPGMHVVDLGAGSGVLSVAAALLGATVTAIDTDPRAPATIAANAARNGVAQRIDTVTADIAEVATTADLGVLNVTIDIHERVAPALRRLPIGPLIVSGILAVHHEARCAAAHGRSIGDRITEDEWAALVLDHGASATPS